MSIQDKIANAKVSNWLTKGLSDAEVEEIKNNALKDVARCIDCKNAYVEDIWNEWDCSKGCGIHTDEEDCRILSDKPFHCDKFNKRDD